MESPSNTLKPVVGPSTFGTVLKHGLKLHRMRQNEFAKTVAVSAVQVSHWVNKTNVPQEETLAKIWLGLEGYMIEPHPEANPQNNFGIYYGFKTNTLDKSLKSLYHEHYNKFMEAYNSSRNSCEFKFPRLFSVSESASDAFSKTSSSSGGNELRLDLLQRLVIEYSILEEELGSLERLGLHNEVSGLSEKLRIVRGFRSDLMDIKNIEKYKLDEL